MQRVVVLALDGVIPFELSVPDRIFRAAGHGLYEVLTCSLDGAPVRTDADFSIAVEHSMEIIASADILVVPPSEWFGDVTGPDRLPPALLSALALLRPGARVASICISTFVLAAAGLLDGRPATTHWARAAHFSRCFPRVRLAPEVLFVDDGDVLTSAGAAAGVDLCLHIVRQDHGSDIANRAARNCVVPPWREGGQAQYIERPVPLPGDSGTAPAREWALANLGLPLHLDDLAARANMSRRTFTRRFREEVGLSPGQWLTTQRVELARHLLESTDLPVDTVASRAGFGTSASLRQHLNAACGVSPHTYRRTFSTRSRAARTP
ncbi:GlxA family transcriptional regulator [Nonomuraea soli]|uniref:Transcriptional regulator GlxA family with amidase domain n=1 Tax=Nonomuraea soli TaxID=1032476 RepID=A0A7W0CN51_9ACTN|nr:helix-turn-helix domain-containing protein [Nonomuraea soli]MBA2894181.1 transcriptional regulator GlxA family with amidase domain [Nonomuraea soli]